MCLTLGILLTGLVFRAASDRSAMAQSCAAEAVAVWQQEPVRCYGRLLSALASSGAHSATYSSTIRRLASQRSDSKPIHMNSSGHRVKFISPSLIPEILFLVEQIGPTATQVDDLRASISVLLQARALEAVEGIADTLAAAHDALVLVVAKGALVADAHESGRSHVGVADGAFAVTFVAEPADADARLLAAHYEIAGKTG
jgi:hypothetical protein